MSKWVGRILKAFWVFSSPHRVYWIWKGLESLSMILNRLYRPQQRIWVLTNSEQVRRFSSESQWITGWMNLNKDRISLEPLASKSQLVSANSFNTSEQSLKESCGILKARMSLRVGYVIGDILEGCGESPPLLKEKYRPRKTLQPFSKKCSIFKTYES